MVADCSPREPTPPSGFVNGVSVHTINVGGLDRGYRLYKPAGLPPSAPLVVMPHGALASATQAERAYGWDELADTAKFVVAYPDGLHRTWNAKVYATGISNGGIMSYTLACNTGVFAAIGPDAATQLDPCPSPHPTSVLHIHGTADRLVPYNGGQGWSVINGPPVAEVNAFWRNVDRCGASTTVASGPVSTSTTECRDNRGVVLVTVDDGGHDWPSFATGTLWQFFAAHSR